MSSTPTSSNCLAIIPARGGSKRLPGKNLRIFDHPEFGKLSLLEIAIRVSRQSKLIDRIIVSSDSEAILNAAARKGVSLHRRPDYLATDNATSEAVIASILFSFPPAALPQTFVLLQPTSPLRTAADIDDCIKGTHRFTCFVSVDPDGQRNGAVYACRSEAFLERLAFPAQDAIIMPASRSLDIDTEADIRGI